MAARWTRASAVALLLITAACSNDEPAVNKGPHSGAGTAQVSTAGSGQKIVVMTGRDYRFHPSTITASAGPLTIVLENAAGSGAPHDLQVDKVPGAFVPLARAGTTTQATFTVNTPGTYQFVCTIHIAQGQIGTLVVKPAP